MRDRFVLTERPIAERLAEWPGMQARIKEVLQLKETDGEPFFFMVEGKTEKPMSSPLYRGDAQRIEAPIAVMLNYLFPNFSEADFDRIAGGGGTQEELDAMDAKLKEVKGMVHFQPGGVIEPSMDDLDIAHHLYSLYLVFESLPPLQIVGRKNQSGKVDLLALEQIADLPPPEVVMRLPQLVEKHILLQALPGYFERSDQPDQATTLRQSLLGLKNLQFDQFIVKYKKITAKIPDQETAEAFQTQFRANFTVFPEYLSCVQAALSEFGCFKISITTIDPDN